MKPATHPVPRPAHSDDEAPAARAPRQAWTLFATQLAPGQARRALRDYVELVGLPERLVDDVQLCVSEAVTNVVLHAYRDAEGEGTVEIEASIDGDLRVCVRDSGSGFAVRESNPGMGLGLGLPIVTQLTRTFHIRTTSRGDGTEVIMRFALP